MRRAASHPDVHAVGCTPYVESSRSNALRALRYIFSLAEEFGKDVDLHIDYSLDASAPLLWDALALLKQHTWIVDGRPRQLTMGHATVLSQFDAQALDRLAQECKGEEVVFVALPTSDLHMQGRDVPYAKRPRATLPALELAWWGVWGGVDVKCVFPPPPPRCAVAREKRADRGRAGEVT
jgi:cytosine deaminase